MLMLDESSSPPLTKHKVVPGPGPVRREGGCDTQCEIYASMDDVGSSIYMRICSHTEGRTRRLSYSGLKARIRLEWRGERGEQESESESESERERERGERDRQTDRQTDRDKSSNWKRRDCMKRIDCM
ncbi:hypothetical protein M758_8G193800 [Ceratodon purpureus]|nr:hypothetical protein M758_8G193800 [Ceratodon purpureus]